MPRHAPSFTRRTDRRPSRLPASILAVAAGLVLAGSVTATPAGADDSSVQRADAGTPAGPPTARLLRDTQLRSAPGGAVVTTLGQHTEFGTDRVLAVVARHGAGSACCRSACRTPAPAGSRRPTPTARQRARSSTRPFRPPADRPPRRRGRAPHRDRGRTRRDADADRPLRGHRRPSRHAAASSYGCCVMPITGTAVQLPARSTVSRSTARAPRARSAAPPAAAACAPAARHALAAGPGHGRHDAADPGVTARAQSWAWVADDERAMDNSSRPRQLPMDAACPRSSRGPPPSAARRTAARVRRS